MAAPADFTNSSNPAVRRRAALAPPETSFMSTPISRNSPLWDPAWDDIDDGPPPRELDLDCGSKQSIARAVSRSPMRYSGSFASKVPRFQQDAYYSAADPRQRAAKERSAGTREYKRSLAGQDALTVKPCTPQAQVLNFNSPVPRFKEGGGNKDFLGLHPNFLIGKEMVRVPTAT